MIALRTPVKFETSVFKLAVKLAVKELFLDIKITFISFLVP